MTRGSGSGSGATWTWRGDEAFELGAQAFGVVGAAAGLHLLVRPGCDGEVGRTDGPGELLVGLAAGRGVQIACIEQYRVHNQAFDGTLVLGYGTLADNEITPAVSRLADTIAATPGR